MEACKLSIVMGILLTSCYQKHSYSKAMMFVNLTSIQKNNSKNSQFFE